MIRKAAGLRRAQYRPLLERMLEEDPQLEARVEASELLDPWLWTGALGRLYFVYALRLARR